MAFRAAIFDLDGVLVDSARLHFVAWRRIADELGIAFDEHDNEALKGVDRMGSLDHILALGGMSLDLPAKEQLAARKNGYYLDALGTMSDADILPGATALLASARAAGLSLGVASASRNAVMVLERAGLSGSIDFVADAARVARSKPAPDIFLACAAGLGVAPAACVGFEDAAAGVTAIKAADMVAIGIGDAAILAAADLVFTSTAAVDLDWVLRLAPAPSQV
ncbi:beta-phosphoglucomutase [Sphingomonas pruni]|uniref:beta-phosphoglucomutase n=1 Tax=Sphingomonas pruni TaxID=40683 RepID=UPI000832C87E|nr:beta-phosphoglucomutase [Sphingomonas pruni]